MKMVDITPLTALDTEDGEIPANDDPALYLIKYLIKTLCRYFHSNQQLKKILPKTFWHGCQNGSRKSSCYSQYKILAAIDGIKAAQKKDVTDVDGIKDIVNVQLDPAIEATSMFIKTKMASMF